MTVTAPNEPTLNVGTRFVNIYKLNADGTPDVASNPDITNALLVAAGLALDATAEKFKTTQDAVYVANGVPGTKAATSALTFSAAHVITASKYGVILVQIDAAGAISTKVPASPQAYNDAPTALAALPSPDTGCIALGHIAIANNTGDWTANTDDLTDGSDVTTAAFTNTTETITPYEGVQIKGSTAFDLTFPEPRRIVGQGEDGVTGIVVLPPNDTVKGTINAEASAPKVAALVDGTKVRTLGGTTLVGSATDQQGNEPRVGLICQQICKGLETQKLYWHTQIIPSTQIVRQGSGMGQDKSSTKYTVNPDVASAHLWGEAMSKAVDGYDQTQVVEGWSNGKLIITSFLGTGSEDEFVFPVARPSASTYADTTKVFVNDVAVTSNITIAATKVTFAAGHEPAAGARIDIVRELA